MIRKYIATPDGGGIGVVVFVEFFVSLCLLHDKNLCTSPPMTLHFHLCSYLLERWTVGMRHIVVFLNNDILFRQHSLRITFFHVFYCYNLVK
jgi:hypothetical protein